MMLKASVCLAICIVLAMGCNSQSTQIGTHSTKQLRLLGTLYGQYMAQHNGRAPANEKQFREFVLANQTRSGKEVTEAVDALLHSPTDGQPLRICYGELTGQVSPNGYPWIAHEQTGVNGMIKIISARGELDEVNKEELVELFSD